MTQPDDHIRIRGAREHNLKGVDLDLPKQRLIVMTGPSGSGKSSLAFDTLFAEGQRRYVESLSAYARQFLGQLKKPAYDAMTGLSPTIAIEQKTVTSNPRSTVGTITEVHDFLRVLFARVGTMHCPTCGAVIRRETPGQMVERIAHKPVGTKLILLAPLVRKQKGDFAKLFDQIRRDGFARARVDGALIELDPAAKPPKLDARKDHTIEVVVDRLIVKDGMAARLLDSLETALKFGDGVVVLASLDGAADERLSSAWRCDVCERDLPELSPALFSFNAPHGMCPICKGLGTSLELDPDKLVPDPSLSLDEGAIVPWAAVMTDPNRQALTAEIVDAVCAQYAIPKAAPFETLTEAQRRILFFGAPEPIKFTAKRAHGVVNYDVPFEGVARVLERRWRETKSEAMREQYQGYMASSPCTACGGSRIREEARQVRFQGRAIHELSALPLSALSAFFDGLALVGNEAAIAGDAVREVRGRLGFLVRVGVGYLALARGAATLSGGESQRIRLASQIGTELTGIVYVLDEPSIGLHPKDGAQLIEALERLRDLGNTVVVVEHDEAIIRAADWVVDFGPGAGEAGGQVVGQGTATTLADPARAPTSVTGPWLAGTRSIAVPSKRRKARGTLTIEGATEHNLQDITVQLPLGTLTVVTGVSGAGKSTLIGGILEPALRRHLYGSAARPGAHRRITGLAEIDKLVTIDQEPIGRTPRSNPATYTKVFDEIRKLFAQTKDAKAAGYGPGRFSFNMKGGRCEACQGDGVVTIEMHFLPDVYVTCEVCRGRRFNDATLGVKVHGLDIAQVLDTSVADARQVFQAVPAIARVLDTLEAVGLGYLRLGPPANTLSGGEAQRLKLSRELARVPSGHTLYILDEPSTGLHFQDVERLLGVLDRLVDAGHTVLVIEHHLDVIKRADWVLDLGPEGGSGGGALVAAGTPEAVAQIPGSHTGRYLAALFGAAARPAPRARKPRTAAG